MGRDGRGKALFDDFRAANAATAGAVGARLRAAHDRVRATAWAAGNSRRLLALIEDLLTLSRIESGTFTVNRSPVALAALIDGIVEELAPRITARSLDLAVAAVVENVGFRQVHAWWRLRGLYSAVRRETPTWGTMTRTGFTRQDANGAAQDLGTRVTPFR